MTRLQDEICIIGGGFAGLCASLALSEAGFRVRVFERERMLCTHSSAKNAAIFRSFEHRQDLVDLCGRSRVQLNRWVGNDWLDARGALYVAPSSADLETDAAGFEILPRATFESRLPTHIGTDFRFGVWVPSDGVMDIHKIQQAIRRRAQRNGVQFCLHHEAISIENPRRQHFVIRSTAGTFHTSRVVNAAGAWADELVDEIDTRLGLFSMRRHLVTLKGKRTTGSSGTARPVLWGFGASECYIRSETAGFLASPADEELHPPGVAVRNQAHLQQLAERLARLAPEDAKKSVAGSWACLRTFAADRLPVVGEDPRMPGFYWMAGLGGRGMTTGAGLAISLRDEIVSGKTPVFSPGRLLQPRVHQHGAYKTDIGIHLQA